MKFNFHCNIFTTVQRSGKNDILAQSHLVDTAMNASAKIRASVNSFKIFDARWDIYHSPGGKLNAGGEVVGLRGAEAYIDVGPVLRAATESLGTMPRYLLTDCIAGIVLGEIGILKERGYSSLDELEHFWRENQATSCYRFAHMDKSTQSWAGYIEGNRSWTDCLFNRTKTATIFSDDSGKIKVCGTLADFYHELSIIVTFDKGIIVACDGQFLRCPDSSCLECIGRLDDLIGKSLNELTKKELGRYIGGPLGCSHLLDILDHIKLTINQAHKYDKLKQVNGSKYANKA